MLIIHRMRGGAPKTTGQIQNGKDFFEAGFAEVPPRICFFSGREFGAHTLGAYWGGRDFARPLAQAEGGEGP
jgi:hypothetical protein